MYGSNTAHGLAIIFTSEFKKLATTVDSSKAPKIKKNCEKIVFNYSDSEIIISQTIIMFIFYNYTNVGYNEINFSYFISLFFIYLTPVSEYLVSVFCLADLLTLISLSA